VATKNPTHCYDLHATVLHLLGIGHEKLIFRHNGIELQSNLSIPAGTGNSEVLWKTQDRNSLKSSLTALDALPKLR
jgi:arylsulfatase A-like enzyme